MFRLTEEMSVMRMGMREIIDENKKLRAWNADTGDRRFCSPSGRYWNCNWVLIRVTSHWDLGVSIRTTLLTRGHFCIMVTISYHTNRTLMAALRDTCH